MKCFKLITLLFGISYSNTCSYSNLSSSLNYTGIISDNRINNYKNSYAIVGYNKHKNVYKNFSLNVNNIVNLLFVILIVFSSLLCSVVFVSNYVYSSMINQFVDMYNTNKNMYEYDPYLFEYLDEFNNMKSSVLSVDFLNLLKYKFLKHNTPKGEIIMNYNHLYSSFDYYCKKSNIIEFSYLDVVSRIYVVKNNCKNIYVDKSENYDYGLVNDDEVDVDVDKDVDKDIDVDVDKDVDKDVDVDVNNKNESSIFYNKLNKLNKSNKSNNKVKSNENNDYVSNRYKYKGTIEEFYSYCETNYYKIHYSDLLENSDTNNSITFSIDKEEESLITRTMEYSASNSNKYNIRFKEFKKFQKF